MGKTQPRTVRVIVAEDHDEMRLHIVKILRRRFEIIEAVACGNALVDAALVFTPDVIVTDIAMPGLSGPEAMAALAEAGCRAAFVLVTAGASDALEWLNRGAMAVVDKFDLDKELVLAVDSAASGFSYLSTRARRVH